MSHLNDSHRPEGIVSKAHDVDRLVIQLCGHWSDDGKRKERGVGRGVETHTITVPFVSTTTGTAIRDSWGVVVVVGCGGGELTHWANSGMIVL